jgi:hypothetical protein
MSGTYVSVEPFHLFRYLDEHAYRYNNQRSHASGPFDHFRAGLHTFMMT